MTVTGGEPFLRKDFVEIISNIIKNSGVPRVSINSNGFYVDRVKDFLPPLIKKFKDTEFTLSISIDGPEKIHDKVREFEGAYEKAKETLEKINMSNEELEKELDRTLEMFKQMEFDEKLEKTINKLNKLSKEQGTLSEETKKDKKSTDEALQKKQKKVLIQNPSIYLCLS